MSFEFDCRTCGQRHKGLPSFGPEAPAAYEDIPDRERQKRCRLGSDGCVIDEKYFFVRGCLEIPIQKTTEQFVWLVWCSLSHASFEKWTDTYEQEKRSHVGPFFGWLNTALPLYGNTLSLKTMVHLRDDGLRPLVIVEPTDHQLAVAQREGISAKTVEDMVSALLHPH